MRQQINKSKRRTPMATKAGMDKAISDAIVRAHAYANSEHAPTQAPASAPRHCPPYSKSAGNMPPSQSSHILKWLGNIAKITV